MVPKKKIEYISQHEMSASKKKTTHATAGCAIYHWTELPLFTTLPFRRASWYLHFNSLTFFLKEHLHKE